MSICRYIRGDIEPPYVYWDTAYKRGIVCESELPTDHGRLYCPFCGRQVKLAYEALKEDSYDGWKAKGYYVMKGEKSHSRDANGICLFTEEQVAKIVPKTYSDLRYRDDPFPDDDIPF
jgi:hypothetical protein